MKQVQTRCTKLEEGLDNTVKTLDEVESNFSEKQKFAQAQFEQSERKNEDEFEVVKSRLLELEKKMERAETSQIP